MPETHLPKARTRVKRVHGHTPIQVFRRHLCAAHVPFKIVKTKGPTQKFTASVKTEHEAKNEANAYIEICIPEHVKVRAVAFCDKEHQVVINANTPEFKYKTKNQNYDWRISKYVEEEKIHEQKAVDDWYLVGYEGPTALAARKLPGPADTVKQAQIALRPEELKGKIPGGGFKQVGSYYFRPATKHEISTALGYRKVVDEKSSGRLLPSRNRWPQREDNAGPFDQGNAVKLHEGPFTSGGKTIQCNVPHIMLREKQKKRKHRSAVVVSNQDAKAKKEEQKIKAQVRVAKQLYTQWGLTPPPPDEPLMTLPLRQLATQRGFEFHLDF